MIISRTPYRISLFGGGTDYPTWYRKHGGKVLATTIDKYLYITVRRLHPYFKHRLRLVYSVIEECQSCEELKHPAAREVLRYLGVRQDVEIHYDGDLPGRSGMGSSSAFTVGLLNGLSEYLNRNSTPYTLAEESIHIEQQIIGESVGSQDQVSAAHGGFNIIEFQKNDVIAISQLEATKDRVEQLNDHLMLFYTGESRIAETISTSYLQTLNLQKDKLFRLYDMVEEAQECISGDRDLCRIGELLDESWVLKRSLSDIVSNENIDAYYSAAKSAGALGGKLTGAGGGGMLLLFVRPENQQSVCKTLSHLLHIPFRFETTGSQIIFSDSRTQS